MAIQDIHNELFELLYEHFQLNPDFKFRPRKTNRSNRLEDGYWFLGNNEYLAVGFWTGDDWRTKIPGISFMVNHEGACWLHFSATDTDEKFNFIVNKIFPAIGINEKEKDFRNNGGKYTLAFKSRNLKDCLFEFLTTQYPFIDLIIQKKKVAENGINIIEDEVFLKDLNKILKYKEQAEQNQIDLEKMYKSKITGFHIENYGPVKSMGLTSIPHESQWIFLTGENGVGKSSILKALSSAIGYRRITPGESADINKFSCKIFTGSRSSSALHFHRTGNNQTNRRTPLLFGFAAYGPFRLQPIYGGLKKSQLKEARSKNGHSHTLFSNNAYLLDLETQFKEWYDSPKQQEFERRNFAIKEFIEGILVNVGEVIFGKEINGIPVTMLREKDGDDNLFDPISIEKLSSGYLSIMAMMSDLLVRLFRQQPYVYDPGELKGVVFIDEIDIHLHPNFQKHFVEQLSAAFPKVQFIVTTHSPIPLLGAPKNSVIGVVKRNVEQGTYIERVDDKIYIEELLPNTILTSPIFGMDNIVHEDRDKETMVRTEKTFDELKFVDKLNERIESFLTDEKEKSLIERFKNKRK